MYRLDNSWILDYIRQRRFSQSRYQIDLALLQAGNDPYQIEAAWQVLNMVPPRPQPWLYRQLGGLTGLAVGLVALNFGLAATSVGFYPVSRYLLYPLLGLCLLALIGWIGQARRTSLTGQPFKPAPLILSGLAGLFCLLALNGSGPFGAPSLRINTVQAANHQYYLSSQGDYPLGRGPNIEASRGTMLKIYKCDNRGKHCTRFNSTMYDGSVLNGKRVFRLELAPDGQALQVKANNRVYFTSRL